MDIWRTLGKGPLRLDAPGAGPNLPYIPVLDGVRAIATMGFHGGVFLTSGRFFGVDASFTLSGLLITLLLLAEWQQTATVRDPEELEVGRGFSSACAHALRMRRCPSQGTTYRLLDEKDAETKSSWTMTGGWVWTTWPTD